MLEIKFKQLLKQLLEIFSIYKISVLLFWCFPINQIQSFRSTGYRSI